MPFVGKEFGYPCFSPNYVNQIPMQPDGVAPDFFTPTTEALQWEGASPDVQANYSLAIVTVSAGTETATGGAAAPYAQPTVTVTAPVVIAEAYNPRVTSAGVDVSFDPNLPPVHVTAAAVDVSFNPNLPLQHISTDGVLVDVEFRQPQRITVDGALVEVGLNNPDVLVTMNGVLVETHVQVPLQYITMDGVLIEIGPESETGAFYAFFM